MNDVGFPVADVCRHRGRARPWAWGRSRSIWWSSEAQTTTKCRRWRGTSAARASRCASSSSWTLARPTAGAWTRCCLARAAAAPAGGVRPATTVRLGPGETAERWGHADGSGEIGLISSVTQAFAATATAPGLDRRSALPCLFATRAGTCATWCAAMPRATRPCRTPSPPSGASGATATHSCVPVARRCRQGERRVEMHYIGG